MSKLTPQDPFENKSYEPTDQEVFDLQRDFAHYRETKVLDKDISWYGLQMVRMEKIQDKEKHAENVHNEIMPLSYCHWSAVQYAIDRGLIIKKNDEWKVVGCIVGSNGGRDVISMVDFGNFRKKCRALEKKRDARIYAEKRQYEQLPL